MNVMDLTAVAQAMIALVTALIGLVAVPWLQAKFDAEEVADFLRWVEIGVAAAEQLYAVNEGTKKKNYVVNFLTERGFTVDSGEIENAIEAAVLQLHKELYYA